MANYNPRSTGATLCLLRLLVPYSSCLGWDGDLLESYWISWRYSIFTLIIYLLQLFSLSIHVFFSQVLSFMEFNLCYNVIGFYSKHFTWKKKIMYNILPHTCLTENSRTWKKAWNRSCSWFQKISWQYLIITLKNFWIYIYFLQSLTSSRRILK